MALLTRNLKLLGSCTSLPPPVRNLGRVNRLPGASCGCPHKAQILCLTPLNSTCTRLRARSHTLQASGSASGLATTVDAKDVITRYYDAYNAGDIETIGELLAEDCSYHDMIYEEPFEGRAEILAYLRKVRKIVPGDLKFVIEDATSGDPFKVGIMWHVECGEGITFPFSRGCSFYTLNSDGKITQARDLVESSLKPGSSALQLLGAMTPVIRRLGPNADPANLRRLPLAAAGFWAFYAAYSAYILLGTSAPGLPAWQTPPETIVEVFNLSLNFFYVNIGLNAAGISMVPSVPAHPVYEGLFNFINAWSLMSLPLILSDGRCEKVTNKAAWWTGIMFLTNVFFIPFMAIRAAPEPEPLQASPSSQSRPTPPPRPPANKPLPGWSSVFGFTSLAVGLLSIGWVLAARPEYGDLAARSDYFQTMFSTDRVFYAFIVDAGLYSVWQAMLLDGQEAKYRFVPFFGLAAYLISGGSSNDADGR